MVRSALALLVLALALTPVIAQSSLKKAVAPSNSERLAALDASKVTFDDALFKSLDRVVNGFPYRIELTTLGAKPVYDITMLVGDPVHHMTLSAVDGSVIAQTDGSFNKHGTVLRIRLGEPNVGLVQAMQLAEATLEGFRAYSSEAIVRGNEVHFEVRLVSKAETKHVTISLPGDILTAGPPPLMPVK